MRWGGGHPDLRSQLFIGPALPPGALRGWRRTSTSLSRSTTLRRVGVLGDLLARIVVARAGMLEQHTGVCDRARSLECAIAQLAHPSCRARPTSVVHRGIGEHRAHDPAPAFAPTLTPMSHPSAATMSNSAITATIRRHRSGWPSIPPGPHPAAVRRPEERVHVSGGQSRRLVAATAKVSCSNVWSAWSATA